MATRTKALWVIGVLLLVPRLCAADTAPEVNFSAKQFAEWVKSTGVTLMRKRFQLQAETATTLEAMKKSLLQRLADERWTTDEAIKEVVDIYEDFESPRPGRDGARDEQGHLFPKTQQLLNDLLPLCADRPEMLIFLHREKAYCFHVGREIENAIKELETTVGLATAQQLTIDRQRLFSMTKLASLLSARGDEKRAASLYRTVRAYMWEFVKDPQAQEDFKQIYAQATSGLINTLRGNLEELKAIGIGPAFEKSLLPELNEAIKEATNKE
jgi:hypothetical protein